jgi:hypothetical protein
MISRLIVEGDLFRVLAIEREESPAAIPREISSLSGKVSVARERVFFGGRIPPLLDKMPVIDELFRSNS